MYDDMNNGTECGKVRSIGKFFKERKWRNDGYLTIEAAKGLDEDEQEKKTGKYIRKERYAGACQRSFYVGDNLTQEDIKGEFKHGILTLNVPKKEAKPAVETNKYIAIEG